MQKINWEKQKKETEKEKMQKKIISSFLAFRLQAQKLYHKNYTYMN